MQVRLEQLDALVATPAKAKATPLELIALLGVVYPPLYRSVRPSLNLDQSSGRKVRVFMTNARFTVGMLVSARQTVVKPATCISETVFRDDITVGRSLGDEASSHVVFVCRDVNLAAVPDFMEQLKKGRASRFWIESGEPNVEWAVTEGV